MGDEPPKRKRKAVRFEEEANESSRKATKRRRETSNGEPADATEANQLWWSSHEIKSLRKETLHERDSLQRAPKSAVYARALWLAYMAAGPNAELVAALECGLARGVESLLVPQLALERFALRRISIQAVLQLQKELGCTEDAQTAISAIYAPIAHQAGSLAQTLGQADAAAAKSASSTLTHHEIV